MGFIQIILFIIIAVVLAGLLLAVAVIRNIYRMTGRIFGKKNGGRQSARQEFRNGNSDHAAGQNTTGSPKSNRKKVFDDDEGEYVDFEEIK